MKRSFFRRDEKGLALVLILVFTGTLMLLGGTLISFAFNEILISNYQTEDIRIYYLAESGIETGFAILQLNYDHEEEITKILTGVTINITFSPNGQGKIITSIATGFDSRKTISVQVENDPTHGLVITKWLKP